MRRVSTLMLMFLSLMFPSVGEKNAICAEERCGEWATRIHSKVQWYPEYVHDSSDLILFVPGSSCILEMDLQDTTFIDVKCRPPSAPPTRSSASWPTCPNTRLLRGVHRTHASSYYILMTYDDIGNRPFPVSSETKYDKSANQKDIKLRSGSKGSYSKMINHWKIVNLKKYCKKTLWVANLQSNFRFDASASGVPLSSRLRMSLSWRNWARFCCGILIFVDRLHLGSSIDRLLYPLLSSTFLWCLMESNPNHLNHSLRRGSINNVQCLGGALGPLATLERTSESRATACHPWGSIIRYQPIEENYGKNT